MKSKLVMGVGVNDSECKVQPKVNGRAVMCRAYKAWNGVLRRCYSPIFQDKYPTYRGVTVCPEWLYFSNFKKWYDENFIDGWEIDKDLLTDSREYGTNSCVFVPGWLNKFTNCKDAARGQWPVGVYWNKRHKKYAAICSNHLTKKREFIGVFHTPALAHRAWLNRKIEIAYQLKDLMDAIDLRIYHNVVKRLFSYEIISW